jgi:hypothetical protein
LAAESAGNNNAARIAMMAMTTSSSIKVNAHRVFIPDKMPPKEIRFKSATSGKAGGLPTDYYTTDGPKDFRVWRGPEGNPAGRSKRTVAGIARSTRWPKPTPPCCRRSTGVSMSSG